MAQSQLKEGSIRTIIADEPASGYIFDQWTGDTAYLDDPLASTTIVTMPAQNVSVTAGYIEIPFTTINYGDLYNWYACVDTRKIASSDDWTLPTAAQWTSLISYVGTDSSVLKTIGSEFWESPYNIGTDAYGFKAKGMGQRYHSSGTFTQLNTDGYYWSSIGGWFRVQKNTALSHFGGFVSSYGFSIKFVKNAVGIPDGTHSIYTGNNGFIYDCIAINGLYWLIEPLAETNFRNGDWIDGFNGGIYTPISNAAWAGLTTGALCAYNNDLSNV